MQARDLNSCVVFLNVKIHDIWEGNMTIKSEVQTKNVRFLGFQDIREGVTIRRLILRRLESIKPQVVVNIQKDSFDLLQ
jgi:hypothetical protein